MKRKLLFALLAGLSFTLGACSLGGNSQQSALPWGQSSAPIFGSSSSSSSSSESKAAYTVTFYVEGRVYDTQEVKKGYQVTRPEDPYKSGYRFLRWEDKNGTRWNFATDTVWSNISLYAVFEQEGYSSAEPSLPYYTVRFFVGGEIYDMQEVKEGYNATPPNDPYIEGYNFLGWAEVGYADYWNFARGVYYNLDLEARFEDMNDYTLTLYGTFTDWKTYSEYERKPGYGFPMIWEGIYFQAKTSFAFRQVYANGNFRNLGWWDLADNSCPHVECESDSIPSIRVKEDVELSFAIYEDLTIHITGWYTPSSSSDPYSTSSEPYYPSSSDPYYPSSSDSYYTSESSSEDRATATLTVNRDNWTKTDEYVRYIDEGFPIVWEDLEIGSGDEFYITVYYPVMGNYHYGWNNLDSDSVASGYFAQTTGGIQVMFGGVYSITFTSGMQIYVSGWESSSSSGYPTSSDSYYSEDSSNSGIFIELTIYQDGYRSVSYGHYESEGYPLVWEGVYMNAYQDFSVMITREDGTILNYGWMHLDSASKESGYFREQTTSGVPAYGCIAVLVSGEYTISFDSNWNITVTGWGEQTSSSESSGSGESSWSTDESSEETLPDGWYFAGNRNEWRPSNSDLGYSDGVNLACWDNIYIENGDYFLFVYSNSGVFDWDQAKSWDSVNYEGNTFLKYDDGVGGIYISCTVTGYYDIFLSSEYKIYFADHPESSSTSEATSESSTSEPSAFAPGYYLICNDNQYTVSDDYVGMPSTDATAVWENYSFDVGDAFMIRHVFDDGHTYDLGYSELLDNCEAYDVVSQYEGTSIRFQESGDYKIVLLSNESILIAHADAESLYNICTLNFYVDNVLYDTRNVTQGFCPTADTFAVPPTKDGYFFDHWEDAEGNTWSLTTTIPHDLDLYAVFVHTYTITLDLNGGSYETTTLTAIEGYNFNLPTPTAPLGMDFDCWLLNDERIEEGYHASYDYGQDITLVAQYVDPYWLFETDASNLITKYNVEGFTSLDIPVYIRGNTVAGIASGAFQGKNLLEQVNLPNTITTIGDSAFADCTNLSVICFNGTLEEWANVSLGASWAANCPATQVICADGVAAI